MIEKEVAINMLDDIKQCLYDKDWKQKTLSTTKQYKKGLLVATNDTVKHLIDELKNYDEDSIQYKHLKSILDERLSELFGGAE